MNKTILTPRWIITTIVVIAAIGVMIRLGFWQLDRMEQRRMFNQRVEIQLNSPPLDLNQALAQGSLEPDDLNTMEYRQVIVRGQYRLSETVVLRNRVWQNQPGYHLFTPLYLDGSEFALLIDRGWIPLDQREMENWGQYDEPGEVLVQGQIRLAQNNRRFGVPDPTLAPGQNGLEAWNAVNIERITGQVQGKLLPVFVVAAPDHDNTVMPYRMIEQPDLSEGSHLGYAIQWFSFAAVLAVGYPIFVRKQLDEHQ
jgi:surfeit locus 1 family protein